MTKSNPYTQANAEALDVLMNMMNSLVHSYFNYHLADDPLYFLNASEATWKKNSADHPALKSWNLAGDWIKVFVSTAQTAPRPHITPQWLYSLMALHFFRETFSDGKKSVAEFSELMLLRQLALALAGCLEDPMEKSLRPTFEGPTGSYGKIPLHGLNERAYFDFTRGLIESGKYNPLYEHVVYIDARIQERFDLLTCIGERI